MDNATDTKQDTALAFWAERRDGYFHLYGAFGYDGGSDHPEWGGYKAERKDGLLFQNLTIVSQGNDASFSGDTSDRRLYGWGVEYRGIYSLDVREADAHAKTLRLLDRRLRKLHDTQGYPKTFGQFVGQVAQAVKATTFYFRQEKPGPYVYSVRRSVGDLVSYVDNWEHGWKEAGKQSA